MTSQRNEVKTVRENTTVSKIQELHKIQREALVEIFRLGTLLPEKTKIKLWFDELNRQTRAMGVLK